MLLKSATLNTLQKHYYLAKENNDEERKNSINKMLDRIYRYYVANVKSVKRLLRSDLREFRVTDEEKFPLFLNDMTPRENSFNRKINDLQLKRKLLAKMLHSDEYQENTVKRCVQVIENLAESLEETTRKMYNEFINRYKFVREMSETVFDALVARNVMYNYYGTEKIQDGWKLLIPFVLTHIVNYNTSAALAELYCNIFEDRYSVLQVIEFICRYCVWDDLFVKRSLIILNRYKTIENGASTHLLKELTVRNTFFTPLVYARLPVLNDWRFSERNELEAFMSKLKRPFRRDWYRIGINALIETILCEEYDEAGVNCWYGDNNSEKRGKAYRSETDLLDTHATFQQQLTNGFNELCVLCSKSLLEEATMKSEPQQDDGDDDDDDDDDDDEEEDEDDYDAVSWSLSHVDARNQKYLGKNFASILGRELLSDGLSRNAALLHSVCFDRLDEPEKLFAFVILDYGTSSRAICKALTLFNFLYYRFDGGSSFDKRQGKIVELARDKSPSGSSFSIIVNNIKNCFYELNLARFYSVYQSDVHQIDMEVLLEKLQSIKNYSNILRPTKNTQNSAQIGHFAQHHLSSMDNSQYVESIKTCMFVTYQIERNNMHLMTMVLNLILNVFEKMTITYAPTLIINYKDFYSQPHFQFNELPNPDIYRATQTLLLYSSDFFGKLCAIDGLSIILYNEIIPMRETKQKRDRHYDDDDDDDEQNNTNIGTIDNVVINLDDDNTITNINESIDENVDELLSDLSKFSKVNPMITDVPEYFMHYKRSLSNKQIANIIRHDRYSREFFVACVNLAIKYHPLYPNFLCGKNDDLWLCECLCEADGNYSKLLYGPLSSTLYKRNNLSFNDQHSIFAARYDYLIGTPSNVDHVQSNKESLEQQDYQSIKLSEIFKEKKSTNQLEIRKFSRKTELNIDDFLPQSLNNIINNNNNNTNDSTDNLVENNSSNDDDDSHFVSLYHYLEKVILNNLNSINKKLKITDEQQQQQPRINIDDDDNDVDAEDDDENDANDYVFTEECGDNMNATVNDVRKLLFSGEDTIGTKRSLKKNPTTRKPSEKTILPNSIKRFFQEFNCWKSNICSNFILNNVYPVEPFISTTKSTTPRTVETVEDRSNFILRNGLSLSFHRNVVSVYLFLLIRERERNSKYERKSVTEAERMNGYSMLSAAEPYNVLAGVVFYHETILTSLQKVYENFQIMSQDTNDLADGLCSYVYRIEDLKEIPYELLHNIAITITTLYILSSYNLEVVLFLLKFTCCIRFPGQYLKSILLLKGSSDSGKTEFVGQLLRPLFSSNLNGSLSSKTLQQVGDEINTDLVSMMSAHCVQCDEIDSFNAEIIKKLLSSIKQKCRLMYTQTPKYLISIAKLIATCNNEPNIKSDAGIITRFRFSIRMSHMFRQLLQRTESTSNDFGRNFALHNISHQFLTKIFARGVTPDKQRQGMFLMMEYFGRHYYTYDDSMFMFSAKSLSGFKMTNNNDYSQRFHKFVNYFSDRKHNLNKKTLWLLELLEENKLYYHVVHNCDELNMKIDETKGLNDPMKISYIPRTMEKDVRSLHLNIDPYEMFREKYNIQPDPRSSYSEDSITAYIIAFLDEQYGNHFPYGGKRQCAKSMTERLKTDYCENYDNKSKSFTLILSRKNHCNRNYK